MEESNIHVKLLLPLTIRKGIYILPCCTECKGTSTEFMFLFLLRYLLSINFSNMTFTFFYETLLTNSRNTSYIDTVLIKKCLNSVSISIHISKKIKFMIAAQENLNHLVRVIFVQWSVMAFLSLIIGINPNRSDEENVTLWFHKVIRNRLFVNCFCSFSTGC
jgi:hypothetical protein